MEAGAAAESQVVKRPDGDAADPADFWGGGDSAWPEALAEEHGGQAPDDETEVGEHKVEAEPTSSDHTDISDDREAPSEEKDSTPESESRAPAVVVPPSAPGRLQLFSESWLELLLGESATCSLAGGPRPDDDDEAGEEDEATAERKAFDCGSSTESAHAHGLPLAIWTRIVSFVSATGSFPRRAILTPAVPCFLLLGPPPCYYPAFFPCE